MGVKKATHFLSQAPIVEMSLKKLRNDIITDLQADTSYHPIICVDVSVWIRAALSNPQADSVVCSQFFAIPLVPVTAVSDYVMRRVSLLRRNKFEVVLVFDGLRFPLKDKENEQRRKDSNIDAKQQALLEAYNNPDSKTFEQVLELRKQAIGPREDVYQEVMLKAKQNDVTVLGAPYEADQQLVALNNMNIADAIVSTDTDLIGQGVRRTISSLTVASGKVKVRLLSTLLENVLPQNIGVNHPLSLDDLRFFCCMLGNDYVRRGKEGLGEQGALREMKSFLSKPDQFSRKSFIDNFAQSHNDSLAFQRALFSWEHGPAFIVCSMTPEQSPKEAFRSQNYTVEIGSMTTCEGAAEDLYIPEESKLGFKPLPHLWSQVPEEKRSSVSMLDFFHMNIWSRTGKPLSAVPKQVNSSGEETFPGALLDFQKVPLKFIPERNLSLFLSSRGVSIHGIDRMAMIEIAKLMDDFKIDALPKLIFRGGGGYVAKAVLEPRKDNCWLHDNQALNEIRSSKCSELEDDSFIENLFSDQFNSKRNRCLQHLTGGSFALEDLKVTSQLVPTVTQNPDAKYFVICGFCAPSQRGIGSAGKLYNVTLAFLFDEQDGSSILLGSPYSVCDCAVGVVFCAHKGALALLVHLIRKQFKEESFESICDGKIDRQVKENAVRELRNSTEPSVMQLGITEDRQALLEQLEERGLERINQAERRDNQVTINLCEKLNRWCTEVKQSVKLRGHAQKTNLLAISEASTKAALLETDPGYHKRFESRMLNLAYSSMKGLTPKVMVGHYATHYIQHHPNMDSIQDITDTFECPDGYSVESDAEEDVEGDDDDGDY